MPQNALRHIFTAGFTRAFNDLKCIMTLLEEKSMQHSSDLFTLRGITECRFPRDLGTQTPNEKTESGMEFMKQLIVQYE